MLVYRQQTNPMAARPTIVDINDFVSGTTVILIMGERCGFFPSVNGFRVYPVTDPACA